LKFAKPKVDIKKLLDIPNYIIVWIPMIKIAYTTQKKKKEMCFDSFTPPKLNIPDAYVWFMRNPKHFKVAEGEIPHGILLEPLVDGKKILSILREIIMISSKFVNEARKSLSKISKRYMLQLLIPAQYPESKKLKASEKYLQLYALLDAIGINEDSQYISEEKIYWPILIDKKENIVFELALKKDPSFSYTEVQKKFDLYNIILEHQAKYE